jgi:hypothetical protein
VPYLKQIVVGIDGRPACATEGRGACSGSCRRKPCCCGTTDRACSVVQKARGRRARPGRRRQRPQRLDLPGLRAGQRAGADGRGARLRHCHVQPRDARAALLPGGASRPRLRLLQGLLRAGDRPPERPRDAPPAHPAAPGAEEHRRGSIRIWFTWTPSAIRSPGELALDLDGAPHPHPRRLGAGGRHAVGGVPQLRPPRDLPVGALRQLRAQSTRSCRCATRRRG